MIIVVEKIVLVRGADIPVTLEFQAGFIRMRRGYGDFGTFRVPTQTVDVVLPKMTVRYHRRALINNPTTKWSFWRTGWSNDQGFVVDHESPNLEGVIARAVEYFA